MATTITICDGSDLRNFLDHMDKQKYSRKEDIILHIRGDFSQQISRTYNAFSTKLRGNVLGYGGAAASVVTFASALAVPTAGLSLFVGSLIGAGVGVAAAITSSDAYQALPYAKEVRELRLHQFWTAENTGDSFHLTRRRDIRDDEIPSVAVRGGF